MSVIAAAVLAASLQTGSWKLVWKDDFEVPGAPNPANWTYEKGYVRNKEKQFYTVDRRENARVEGGKLIIEARKDGFEGHEVTSASLTTQGKRDIQYGRIIVRAKIPTGKGTWPAIWTLGTDISTIGWPKCGEIDMMENVGHHPDEMVFTVHRHKTPAEEGDTHRSDGKMVVRPKAWEGFHDYELRWSPDRLMQYMDGELVHEYRKDPNAAPEQFPFNKPHYLILNLAIGGEWGGQQGIDDAIYPSRFEIDSVRVYTRR